jgi:hypothetical protein
MRNRAPETTLAVPEEIADLHAQTLATVGKIGGALFDHLATQGPGILRPLPGVLLSDTLDRRRQRNSHAWHVKKREDQRMAGYPDVRPLEARIETWAGHTGIGTQVELVLCAPQHDGSVAASALSDVGLRQQSDFIGLTSEGEAFVNCWRVVPEPHGGRPPGLREFIDADRAALQVAGTAIMAAQAGWEGVDPSLWGGGLREAERHFVALGDFLSDRPHSGRAEPANDQWYAPIPYTEFLAQQASPLHSA